MDGMGGAMAQCVERSRQIMRWMFFVAEAGTVGSAIIFMGIDQTPGYSHAFDSLTAIATILLFVLPVFSMGLFRSDRKPAIIGLITFAFVFLLVPVSSQL